MTIIDDDCKGEREGETEREREGGREGERWTDSIIVIIIIIIIIPFFVAVSFSFSRSDYSVPENGGSIVLNVLKEGTTVQPLSIFIESFDITAYGKYTCTLHILIAYLSSSLSPLPLLFSPFFLFSTAGSDYAPINRRELTFLNESSQSIVVFIHNDSFLEAAETFGVRLTTVQSQVIMTQPTVNVTIENDDSKNRVRGGREREGGGREGGEREIHQICFLIFFRCNSRLCIK